MAPSALRKAIGAVKDKASIGKAIVSGSSTSDPEVLIVKATSHDQEEPPDEKYAREIIELMSASHEYRRACHSALSKRLRKTHDWAVAIKALMLAHQLSVQGNPEFPEMVLTRHSLEGFRLLYMSDFRDESSSTSLDCSIFVRAYALYIEERIKFLVSQRKSGKQDEESLDMTPFFRRFEKLLQIVRRTLACWPVRAGRTNRLVTVALYPVVRESFEVYRELTAGMNIIFDRFQAMEFKCCMRAFNCYTSAAELISELARFYNFGKGHSIARWHDFPEVQKIPAEVLKNLQEILTQKGNAQATKSKEEKKDEDPNPSSSKDDRKAKQKASEPEEQREKSSGKLVTTTNPEGSWVTFTSDDGPVATSSLAAAEGSSGTQDWERELDKSVRQTSLQGQDPLAASASVPPHVYVQLADAERQKLIVQQRFCDVSTSASHGTDTQGRAPPLGSRLLPPLTGYRAADKGGIWRPPD